MNIAALRLLRGIHKHSPGLAPILASLAMVLVLGVTSARAAITFDNRSSVSANNTASVSLSHTLGSGVNRLLVVSLALEDATATDLDVSTVTFNGAPMNLVASSQAQTSGSGVTTRTVLYYLLDASLPGSGTYTVSISFAGTVSGAIVGAVSLAGVRQQPAEAVTTGTSTSSTSISTSVTTISADAWVIAAVSNIGSTTTFAPTATGMVERADLRSASNSGAVATKPGAFAPGATAMSWTLTSGSTRSTQSVAAFAEAKVVVSGNVFEDVGYTGGAGRDRSTSGGVGRPSARVELYSSAGTFLAATTAATTGDYAFTVSAASSFTVRVVNSTVTSSLGGTSLLSVQTFRTEAAGGSVVAVTDRVGGEDPTLSDASNGSTTLAALTMSTTTPQSIAPIATTWSDMPGVDFGFNFCTIVRTANTGQGTLRQFLTNANAMSGTQTSVFMISDGAAHPGLRAGLVSQLTDGVAIIAPTSALPTFSTLIVLDGASQTANVGDTNPGTLGTGGTVGAEGVMLSTVARPEIEIVGVSTISYGLSVSGASSTISGIAIHGFGSTISTGDIRINASSVTVSGCVIGSSATEFAQPPAATGGSAVPVASGSSAIISGNLIGFAGYNGIYMASTASTGWSIQANEIRGNGRTNATYGGVEVRGSTNTISGNLIAANKGQGVDLPVTTGTGNTIANNTIAGNGIGTAGTPETPGIRTRTPGTLIDRNRIAANYGAGVMVQSGASTCRITRNSISANGTILNDAGAGPTGQIGIDLLSTADSAATGTAPFRTLNDATDPDAGGNNLFNYPVLDTATVVGANLEITGWASAGATIEVFVRDTDPSGFGEGETFVASLLEGADGDLDATSSSYSGNINCMNQGAGTSVRRFKFVLPLPQPVGVGTLLTATATDASGNTSEFAPRVTVYDNFPDFTVVKSSVTVSDPLNLSANPKAIPGAVMLCSSVVTNADAATTDQNTFVFVDPIPLQMELYVRDIGAVGSGPVLFVNGTISSTLTYTFVALASTIDDLAFSSDHGATWEHVPTPNVDGFDSAITHIRVSLKGAFAKAACGNSPSCTIQYRVRLR
jgi:hypothetical protein